MSEQSFVQEGGLVFRAPDITWSGELHLTEHGKQVLKEIGEEKRQQDAQGGFIESSGMAVVRDEPEALYWPKNARIIPEAKEPMLTILAGDKAREYIRKEVREALEQELQPGAIDPREYMHIDIREADGRRWRGMVYAVEPME